MDSLTLVECQRITSGSACLLRFARVVLRGCFEQVAGTAAQHTGKMLHRTRQHARPPAKAAGVEASAALSRHRCFAVILRFSSLRASTVLESAVEKLGILASLTTDIHNDELSSMLGNPETAVHAKLTDCHTAAAAAFSLCDRVGNVLVYSLAHITRAKPHAAAYPHVRTRMRAHAQTCLKSPGEEISRIIQEQRALEKRYEELIHARRNMKGFSNRIKFQVRAFMTAVYCVLPRIHGIEKIPTNVLAKLHTCNYFSNVSLCRT